MSETTKNLPHGDDDRFKDALIFGYLEGKLNADQLEAFDAALCNDREFSQRFVDTALLMQTLQSPSVSTQLLEDPLEEADQPFGGSAAWESAVEDALASKRRSEIEHEASLLLAQDKVERNRETRLEKLKHDQETKPHQTRNYVIPIWSIPVAIAAAIMLVAIPLATLFQDKPEPNQQDASTPDATIDAPYVAPVLANVVRTLDAQWLDDDELWNGTAGLREGRHHLASGLVEIELSEGTRVLLEAPVSFELTGTNAMKLSHGRLVATVPHAAIGFTVDTPTARITDYGTEFGVRADGQSITQTFSGRVGVSPLGSDDEVPLYAGEAVVTDALGQIQAIEPDALAFVREEEFKAILNADHSDRDRWVAARYRMLRDPGVVAFIPFIRPGIDWPAGMGYQDFRLLDETASVSRTPGRSSYGEAMTWQGDTGIGDALVANGKDPIFIDLDTASGGAFDAAGVLDDNGLIGRPGSTLYIMWRMQSDGTGFVPDAFAGLSLMHGDQRMSDEPLFFGCAASASNWSIHPRRNGALISDDADIHSLTENGLQMPIDNRSHLWLVRIDFADGQDRVQVYLDPDLNAAQLPQASAILTSYDIAFDRLRFVTGDGAVAWRLDDVLISTTRPTGSLGTLSRD